MLQTEISPVRHGLGGFQLLNAGYLTIIIHLKRGLGICVCKIEIAVHRRVDELEVFSRHIKVALEGAVLNRAVNAVDRHFRSSQRESGGHVAILVLGIEGELALRNWGVLRVFKVTVNNKVLVD